MHGIRASDHAVLRYLERVAGFDIEAIRHAMEAECANNMGAPCVKIRGARYLLRDGRIVSVLNDRTVPYWHFLKDLMQDDRVVSTARNREVRTAE